MLPKTSWLAALAAVVLALPCNPGKAAPTDQPDSPEITVPACPAPPFLDGALTDACWQTAAQITNLHILGETGKTSGVHKIRVIRDNAWLYVGFL